MANSRDDKEIFFVDPEERGIIPLDRLHISKSLKKFMKNMKYEISFNKSFKPLSLNPIFLFLLRNVKAPYQILGFLIR